MSVKTSHVGCQFPQSTFLYFTASFPVLFDVFHRAALRAGPFGCYELGTDIPCKSLFLATVARFRWFPSAARGPTIPGTI